MATNAELLGWYKSGETFEQIAVRLGVSGVHARRLCLKAGVKPRPPARRPRTLIDDALVVARYRRGESMKALAREHRTNTNRIRRMLERNNVDVRVRSRRRRLYAQLDDAVWLAERYVTLSASAIARELGCWPNTVRKALIEHGIVRRPPGPQR